MQPSAELLLGKLAVREGFCTQTELEECLQLQTMTEPQPPLGDVLLLKGYLTAPQLEMLLSRQHKKLMACSRCKMSFTVLTLSDGKSARCPRCKDPLSEMSPRGSTRTDAEIATQRMKVPPSAGSTNREVKKVKMVCVICDGTFEWVPDASGRVCCPSCGSTFTASNKT